MLLVLLTIQSTTYLGILLQEHLFRPIFKMREDLQQIQMFTYNTMHLKTEISTTVNAQTERFPAKEASYFRLVTTEQAG